MLEKYLVDLMKYEMKMLLAKIIAVGSFNTMDIFLSMQWPRLNLFFCITARHLICLQHLIQKKLLSLEVTRWDLECIYCIFEPSHQFCIFQAKMQFALEPNNERLRKKMAAILFSVEIKKPQEVMIIIKKNRNGRQFQDNSDTNQTNRTFDL